MFETLFRFYRIFAGILYLYYPIKIPIPQARWNPIGLYMFGRFIHLDLSLIIAK
jgi:hypothetical protein